MSQNNFKELGIFSKTLQLVEYHKFYFINHLPPKTHKEIMILGKSNVGKSTLINTLLNHKIAQTSKRPGCTKAIGYIQLRNVTFIDLPGYGYANVSKSMQAYWGTLIQSYIQLKRTDLIFHLIDARRGMQAIDSAMVNAFNIPKITIFTKIDQKNTFCDTESFQVSAKTGEGIVEMREFIDNFSNMQ